VSEKLKLDITTPQGSVFSGEVDEITATGSEGEFGVLPGHASYITTLKSGSLSLKTDGETEYYFVSWGYAEVGPDKVAILADSAEHATDIDVERAREAHERAIVDMDHEDEEKFAAAEAELERAAARIHVAEHFGTGLKK
jgi:F-type H+-transporting ATPase subunit epsilon